MSIFNSAEFDSILAGIVYDSRVQSPDGDLLEQYDDYQPTLYDEAQDLYGGDDYIEQWEVE